MKSIGIGTILAALISYNLNESILWAIVHGFCGVFYLLYYWLFV